MSLLTIKRFYAHSSARITFNIAADRPFRQASKLCLRYREFKEIHGFNVVDDIPIAGYSLVIGIPDYSKCDASTSMRNGNERRSRGQED